MLKSLRLHKQLTQAQLAKRARVSQPYIVYLEQGVKRNPSLAVLQRLARALGTTSSAVIEALSGRTRGGAR
jgi:transcriptional regulator with XRE-family HTH domain